MSKINQRQAVVKEVKTILGSNFNTSAPVKTQLSKDQIKRMKENITNDIINGKVTYSKCVVDIKEVSRYVGSMIGNYFRKAPELNGGKIAPKREALSESEDHILISMRALLKTHKPDSHIANELKSAIDTRVAEIKERKTQAAEERNKQKQLKNIDMESLSEELKSLANSLI